jgi:hypothetical protein
MNPQDVFSRNPDLIAADMDGETVMMSFERGTYYGIGGIGSRIWELLEQPTKLDAIVAAICAEFDVSEQMCMADVKLFLRDMIENDLVIVE